MGECFSKRSKERFSEENKEESEYDNNNERNINERGDDVNEYMKIRKEGNVKEMMKYITSEIIVENCKMKTLGEIALVDIYKSIDNNYSIGCIEDKQSLLKLIGKIRTNEQIEKSNYITFDFGMLILNKLLTNKNE